MLSFAVLCSLRFKIIDCLSLSRIPFQGLPLLGNLHSVDIARWIGGLICSSLTLNVIHSGQLEAWTFFVRETLPTKSFNQTTQKRVVKVLHGKHSRSCMLWSTQEIQTCARNTVYVCKFVGMVWKKNPTTNLECWSQLISFLFSFHLMRSNWTSVESFLSWKQTWAIVYSRNSIHKWHEWKEHRTGFYCPSPQPWKHFSFSTCFHCAWNHACSFLWLFQGYTILLILKQFFLSFSPPSVGQND